jgi:hypothetical protein
MKKLKLIFTTALIFLFGLSPAHAVDINLPGDIGNFGAWSTPNNHAIIIGNLGKDLNALQNNFQNVMTSGDVVPLEARVARAVISAIERVGNVMERSLFGFISIFIAIMLLFWIMIQGYVFATKRGDLKDFAYKLVKQVAVCGVWIWIISQNPAAMFMSVMGPIIYVGSYFSDLILNTVTSSVGMQIPDSCAAIHNYIAENPASGTLIPGDALANMICVPTRLSGFFYTCVSAGFKWMSAGIGASAMTFFVGLAFVVVFFMNIWKFAIMALGVIVELFLVLLFLPFTAIAEAFKGMKTDGGGMAGDIFGKFGGIFKTVDLSSTIQRFINAVIYFFCLSVIIAVCAALLSAVVTTDMAAEVPTIDTQGFVTVFLTGCLVFYLANQAENLARELGGTGEDGGAFGKAVRGDLKTLWGGTKKNAAEIWKILRK